MSDPSPWAKPPGSESEPPEAETIAGPATVAMDRNPALEPADSPSAAGEPQTYAAVQSPPPLPPAPPITAAPKPESPRGPSRGMLLGLMGFMLVLLLGLGGGLIWYVVKDDSSSPASTDPKAKATATIAVPAAIPYAADKRDSEYDLESMQLRNKDLPDGLVRQSRNDELTFTNAEWAGLLAPDDPDPKQAQLDAQKRIRNLVSVFSWEDAGNARIGTALSLLSQSTLYETVEAAAADANRLCGLRIDETDPLKEFTVPKLGDQSVGFTVTTPNKNFGKLVDTIVCFRTGRIVHGVIQTSFLGAENNALVLELAKKMLLRVNETFKGAPSPKDPEPTSAPTGQAPATPTAGSPTPG